MGSFNGLLDAKFMPPRNWSLDAPLKFKSQTLTKEEREMLVECGIQVTKTTLELGADLPAPSPGDVQNYYKDMFLEVQH